MNKLLIVGASTAVRGIVRDRIARSGLALDRVAEADGSVAALERLACERDLRLVLCDRRLGDEDGLDLVRTIRARFPRDRHRIVVVCREGDTSSAELAREAGADGVVERPFGTEEIHAALAPWCGGEAAPGPLTSRRAG